MLLTAVIESGSRGRRHLRMECAVHNGRVRYRVQSVHGTSVAQLFESTTCESIDDEHWPTSPPWQELHVHESASEPRALLLVGRAGSSHWSMTVSCDEEQAIVFDVACRLRATPEFLGTTYRLAAPAKMVAGAAVLELALLNTIVIVEPLAIDYALSATVAVQADELVIRPLAERPAPATIRWKYRIRAAE